MNHSIYSADRSTHLKIVVLALGGYRGGWLQHLGAQYFLRRLYPDRPCHQGRQTRGGDEFRRSDGALISFTNSRGSLLPPRVAT